ncbi:MAG: hypothetical protein JHC33_05325 [Ignisphaera sp.]|nr:hypothetical protein [Ignisphaera sp.]
MTRLECLEALAAGKVLTTAYGQVVWLDKFGFQQSIGTGKGRKGRSYTFSSPQFWRIK